MSVQRVRDRGVSQLFSDYHPLLQFPIDGLEIKLLKEDDPLANPTYQVGLAYEVSQGIRLNDHLSGVTK